MLKISNISFPGFGIGEFSVNSVAISIDIGDFHWSIAWYALIIACGMVAACLYTIIRSKKIGVTLDDVLDFAIPTILCGILGARLYYVLTKPGVVKEFVDIFKIWEGGLAIYGGIIGGGLAVLVVSYIKKINFLAFADYVAPAVLLAQGIGRWGNFMNGEAYGGICDWFCRMGLQNDNTLFDFGTSELVYVHPTFLYESLWNIIGFLIVAFFTNHKKYDGQCFLLIFAWYGFGRMFIEGLRTDSLYIFGTIRISQLLGGLIFVVCASVIVYFTIRKPTKKLYCKSANIFKNRR